MKVLVIIDQPPYGNAKSQESLDLSLALAAFDGEVSILFSHLGVTNLLPEQLPETQGLKDFTRLVKGLELYDIQHIYLDASACSRLNLNSDNLLTDATLVDRPGIQLLIDEHHQVIKL